MSSGDDSDGEYNEYNGARGIERRVTATGKSSFGEYTGKRRGVRRSVVARNIKGFSQAAKKVMGINRFKR